MDLNRPWTEYDFVVFDTETSGAYPLTSEVVEFGAIRWSQGREVASYQTLLKPKHKMSDFIISIHGITNEMVADAPEIKDKISEIQKFFDGAVAVAHHAPFDLGFMTLEFERAHLSLPQGPVICTSLLSRKVIPESSNHKLQTLLEFLKIPKGTAHRALDDTRGCWAVALECFKRRKPDASLQEMIDLQGKVLNWNHFTIATAQNPLMNEIQKSIETQKDLDIIYKGGSLQGVTRRVTPQGLVRNPDGDYLQALCHREKVSKRFYLQRIADAQIVF